MNSRQKFGIIVVLFGILLLLERLFPSWMKLLTQQFFLPIVIIVFGLYLLTSKK